MIVCSERSGGGEVLLNSGRRLFAVQLPQRPVRNVLVCYVLELGECGRAGHGDSERAECVGLLCTRACEGGRTGHGDSEGPGCAECVGLLCTRAWVAAQVMVTLKDLAAEGKTVVVTIHQPRSSIFALFDDLVLLAEGALVYGGPAAEAVGYFRDQGFQCPPNYNPAEFLADLISLDHSSSEAEAHSQCGPLPDGSAFPLGRGRRLRL